MAEESRFIICPLISMMTPVVTWSGADDRERVVGVACFSLEPVADRSRRNGRERASNVRERGRVVSGVDRNLT
jgi:hypothetical protein